MFGAGISASQVEVERDTVDTDDLFLTFFGTADKITLDEAYVNGNFGVERFFFADGTILTGRDIRNLWFASQVTAGNDTIDGFAYDDTIDGGGGDDTLDGLAGIDTLNGGAGNDTLNGGSGIDTLNGGLGDDILDGGSSGDTMNGGDGNDTYIVDNAADIIVEAPGEGVDLVKATASVILSGSVENLTFTGNGALTGTGNALDNTIIGGGGNNLLSGGVGNDQLDGAAGNDTLFGQDGDDRLTGGLGNDKLTGGAGQDVFDYNKLIEGGGNSEVILDFQVGAGGDILDLDDLLTDLAYFGPDPFADGYLKFTASGANTLIQVDADGAGVGFSLVTLVVLDDATLTAADTANYLT